MHRLSNLREKNQENQNTEKTSGLPQWAQTAYDVCDSVGMQAALLFRRTEDWVRKQIRPLKRVALDTGKRLAAWAERAWDGRVLRFFSMLRRVGAGLGRAVYAGFQSTKAQGPIRGVRACVASISHSMGRHRRFVRKVGRLAVPAGALALLWVTVSVWSSATFALQVNIDGQTVGYVSDESVFSDAYSLMKLRVVEEGTEGFSVAPPRYKMTLVSQKKLSDAATLCDSLITASGGEITEACGLYVDGDLIAVTADKTHLETVLDGILAEAKADPQVVEATFDNDLLYKDGLYPVGSVVSRETAQTLLTGTRQPDEPMPVAQGQDIQIADVDSTDPQVSLEVTGDSPSVPVQSGAPVLTVKLIRTETYQEAIAYETEEVKDSSKLEGYRAVSVPGVKGQRLVTAHVEYVDGQEVGRTVVSEEILSEPTKEKVIVGTRSREAYSQKTVDMAQLFWPVARVERSYISSYFGDNRNHKGLDICAPAGTSIYAAEAGTVVSVNGSGSGYGLHFVIDHGNGVQTLYSHCSTMDVQVGQKVVRGEKLAEVGRTGNATGNHLHFEVRVGGTCYNPAPFLGVEEP